MSEPAPTVTGPLPRGPHNLTRDQVRASQRERILMAATLAVADKGYAATTVADILAGAKVSRSTFYDLFEDKADCFLDACAFASNLVMETMGASLREGEATDPLDRLGQLLDAYLVAISQQPGLARVFLVEVYAAGESAIRQRVAMLDRFVDLVVATLGDSPGLLGSAADQRFAAEVLVGGVSSMVTNAVAVGDADDIRSLRDPMMRLIEVLLRA